MSVNKNYAEKRRKISPKERFRFSCHSGLACFNSCCADINILLTPYDLLRMRRSAGLSSGEFLKRYTVPLLADDGLPLLVLKMNEDETKSCPFVLSEGCMIYPDRPWSCRMYPIFPTSSEEDSFVQERNSCLGLKGEKEWTIDEWKNAQGIDIYEKMNEYYKEITYHSFFQKGNKLDPGKAKLIYRSCYDLDEFKRFLFETRFFDIYDVEKEVIARLREEEEELLGFGYRWIKFNLFGEDTLRLRDKTFDKILQEKRKEFDN